MSNSFKKKEMTHNVVPLLGAAALGLMLVFSATGMAIPGLKQTSTAAAVLGGKTTGLEKGDKLPVLVYMQDKSDPSKIKAEGFTCQVLNAGDTEKDIETLLDCHPAKVLESGAELSAEGGGATEGAASATSTTATGSNDTTSEK